MTWKKDGGIPSDSGFPFFSLSVFFSPTPLPLSSPQTPLPPPSLTATLCTLRFSCRSAAQEKNVDNEIKRKVWRFARGVIRKATGGLGGLRSQECSRNIWLKLMAVFFFYILTKPLFSLGQESRNDGQRDVCQTF